jgi:LPS-assembly protein
MAVLAGAEWLSANVARGDPPPLLIPGPETSANVSSPVASTKTPADSGAYNITGDKYNASLLTGLQTWSGNVDIDYMGYHIQAQQLTKPAAQDGPAQITGQVALTSEALRVLMRKATLDQQKEQIAAEDIRMGHPPAYFDGKTFTLGNQTGELSSPTVFFGEPDPYGLNIVAQSATYREATDDVVLHDATLRIGSLPFFYLPSYTQGRDNQPPLSLQTHLGYRSDLGPYVRTTTFWTPNPAFEPGMLLDVYSDRGVLAGPAMKYDYEADPAWWQVGTLESGFIHDTGNPGLDLNNQPIGTNRFFVDWMHQGTIADTVDITSSMWWWSDSYVLRDYRQDIWQNNELPDNFVEAGHSTQDALLSAFVRYQPNDFEVVQERLPELRMDYFASPLANTTLYQEGQMSYVQLDQQNFNGTPTLHSNRFDAYYGWRRPINFGDWATLTPVVGARVTQYQDTLNDQGQFTRMLGQFGFDADMRYIGSWDYSNPTWDINGLQHIFRPVLQYRYIPGAQQGQGLIPAIDTTTFSSYPPILDLNDNRAIDTLTAQNVLRYGFENVLNTRADGYGSRELLTFNVYNDIHFQQTSVPVTTGQPADLTQDFSDVWTQVGLRPVPWLKLDAFDRLDPLNFTNREVRTSTTILDGDRWSVAFETDSLQHTLDQYWLDANFRINERYRLFGRWRYDEHLGGLTEQTYGISQRFGETWDVQYGISYFRNTTNQNGFGVNVRVILLVH